MKEFIHLPFSKEEVLQCIVKALNHQFVDNLRNRHPNIQFDNKLRGYIGEAAFMKYMNEKKIQFQSTNQLKKESGMDIDFIFPTKAENIHIELKTSLLPDVDQCIEEFVRNRDIKLIRRNNRSIEELEGNIHVQLVFKQLRLRKEKWLKQQNIDFKQSPDILYDQLAAHRYMQDVYFVGWIDKKSLIKLINNKAPHLHKWKYGKREFWCCNIENEALEPSKLINHLQLLKK